LAAIAVFSLEAAEKACFPLCPRSHRRPLPDEKPFFPSVFLPEPFGSGDRGVPLRVMKYGLSSFLIFFFARYEALSLHSFLLLPWRSYADIKLVPDLRHLVLFFSSRSVLLQVRVPLSPLLSELSPLHSFFLYPGRARSLPSPASSLPPLHA